MINLRRILVPTDFSETSAVALRYAIALARRFAARVYLLNVSDHPGIAVEAEYPVGIFETMQNAAHDRLRRGTARDPRRGLLDRCGPGVLSRTCRNCSPTTGYASATRPRRSSGMPTSTLWT